MSTSRNPTVISARSGTLLWVEVSGRQAAFLGEVLIGHVKYDAGLAGWVASLAMSPSGGFGLSPTEEGAMGLMEGLLLNCLDKNLGLSWKSTGLPRPFALFPPHQEGELRCLVAMSVLLAAPAHAAVHQMYPHLRAAVLQEPSLQSHPKN
jgi:hypothetical protein